MVKELQLCNNFLELTTVEMETVNGGGTGAAIAVGVSTGLIAWAPVVAFVPVVGPAVAVGMALTGAAGILIGTNSDFDLIEY